MLLLYELQLFCDLFFIFLYLSFTVTYYILRLVLLLFSILLYVYIYIVHFSLIGSYIVINIFFVYYNFYLIFDTNFEVNFI